MKPVSQGSQCVDRSVPCSDCSGHFSVLNHKDRISERFIPGFSVPGEISGMSLLGSGSGNRVSCVVREIEIQQVFCFQKVRIHSVSDSIFSRPDVRKSPAPHPARIFTARMHNISPIPAHTPSWMPPDSAASWTMVRDNIVRLIREVRINADGEVRGYEIQTRTLS